MADDAFKNAYEDLHNDCGGEKGLALYELKVGPRYAVGLR
jgi:hypothetical protein